jgi:hypothetical protein
MQVAKWGNSPAVRLPAAVVEVLELKEAISASSDKSCTQLPPNSGSPSSEARSFGGSNSIGNQTLWSHHGKLRYVVLSVASGPVKPSS